jgi:hypothetical protein
MAGGNSPVEQLRIPVEQMSAKLVQLKTTYNRLRTQLKNTEDEYISSWRGLYNTKTITVEQVNETIPDILKKTRILSKEVGQLQVEADKLANEIVDRLRNFFTWFEPLAAIPEMPLAVISPDGKPNRILFGDFGSTSTFSVTKILNFDFASDVGWRPASPEPNVWEFPDMRTFVQKTGHPDLKLSLAIIAGGIHGRMFTADWFAKRYGDDLDIYQLRYGLPAGPMSAGHLDSQPLNFLRLDVQEYLREFVLAYAGHFRKDSHLLYYIYAAEEGYGFAQYDDKGNLTGGAGGWGPTADKEFCNYLKKKYKTIEILNETWRDKYAAFEKIKLPADGVSKPRYEASGLTYEFEKWRKDTYASHFKRIYDTFKKNDPFHPVVTSPRLNFMNGPTGYGLDVLKLGQTVDIMEQHDGTWGTHDEVYIYSLAHYLEKTIGRFEHIWNQPEGWHNPTEDQSSCAGERNIWRSIAWGRTVFFMYGAWDTFSGNTSDGTYNSTAGNYFLVPQVNLTILRYGIGFVPHLKNKLYRINDVFLRTKVVKPDIAILQPSVATINAWPQSGPARAAINFHDILYKKNYNHFFVPEELLLNGQEELNNFKVLCIPYGTHFPHDLEKKIMGWIQSGGLLIATAPFGIYNEYGVPDGKLWNTIFGEDLKVSHVGVTHAQSLQHEKLRDLLWEEYAGHRFMQDDLYVWKFVGYENNKDIKIRISQGDFAVLETKYGKGRVLVTSDCWKSDEAHELLIDIVGSVCQRPAFYEGSGNAEVVLRAAPGNDKYKYLVVLNPDSSETINGRIVFAGQIEQVCDLAAGPGGCPIPISTLDYKTTWPVHLEPGEGTVYRLK